MEIGRKHDLAKLKYLPMYQAITQAGITVTSTSRTIEAKFPPLLVARYLGVGVGWLAVVAAGAAAETARTGAVAAQFLAAEAHRIELLVGLEVGQRQPAEGEAADLEELAARERVFRAHDGSHHEA